MQPRHAKRSSRKARASTGDVLGAPKKADQVKPKWRKYYQRLIQLRNALAKRQATLSKDALEENPAFSSHMADAGTDTYDRDFALSLLSAEQDAVYEIEEALDRIRNNSYGVCELTGKPIEPERLDAIPWTRFTAAAEKQLERDGAVDRTRLGQREAVTKISPTTAQRESDADEDDE
jgi:RNA polymerase-binding transcription factor DksA